ncbi:MAG: dipeptide ABC transporter ATP-binding protein [Bdellovibrionaceae bacterium]|jgi:peptide/nickel transport system ATP-binding protein|nr:dipeptide ABC transporter ATP-binding protein [Pseudobdellovibrionaceae bacterium]
MSDYLVEVKNLTKHFPIHGGIFYKQIGKVHALNGVDFKIKRGETLGVVGESGCGKSTLGKTLLRLYDPTDGKILFEGEDLCSLDKKQLRDKRRHLQMIFQDPYESLNSRHTIRKILIEPFIIHNIGDRESRIEEVKKLLKRVGLPESSLDRFPHEFSGGQRQRIGIARAIALQPKLIMCDEAVSALDVSVQSQVLNLLVDLQNEMNLTYIFISHDLSVVKHVSDRIIVMYLGHIVEIADAAEIYKNPQHPYTKALLSSIPVPDPTVRNEKQILEGDIPSPQNPPPGCTFHTRCPLATERCKKEIPRLKAIGNQSADVHSAACFEVEK